MVSTLESKYSIMKIKILFTTRDSFFSNAIRDVTGEPVSHCAIEIPERKIVIHSNIKGVHIQSSYTFRKQNKIVLELEGKEFYGPSFIDQVLAKDEFRSYDFSAFVFLGLSLAARKYLKLPLPKSNLWDTTGMLCTEWVTNVVDRKTNAMITPYKLYLRLLSSGEWKVV